MKQQILSQIKSKLSELGIPVQECSDTDIAIITEFLDAGWSIGSKKINYEALVLLDEQQQTVFMYEKTSEIGQGFSFGSDSESTFQSGSTLYRKVKSLQYGLDGKAYEYALNLGQISKTVKEAAKHHGWKFKTVLNRSKAMYPVRCFTSSNSPTVEFHNIPSSPQASSQDQKDAYCKNYDKAITEPKPQQNPVPQKAFYAQSKESSKKAKKVQGGLFGIIFLTIITVLLFALMKVSILGWILGAATLLGMNFLLKGFASKGFFKRLIIVFMAIIFLFFILIFTMG